MSSKILAYLAGAIDSDGCLSIRKSTYHARVRRDAKNPTYSERVTLKQVTPQIPDLLHQTFGGSVMIAKGGSTNSKPLFSWSATDRQAAELTEKLKLFLLVKKKQAEVILELRKSKEIPYCRFSYWFEKENPNWRQQELVTASDAMKILGYTNPGSLAQAVRNGSLLCLPYERGCGTKPRFPKIMLEQFINLAGCDGYRRRQPMQLVEWRESLFQEIKELNKIGVNGTAVYRREGVFAHL